MDDRLRQALSAIDAANAADPNRITVRGESGPKELLHAQLASEWVRQLRPVPSEALALATRAHHLGRWRWPRSTYPEGRAGYLRWRRDLHQRHASELAEILQRVGYDPDNAQDAAIIERTAAIIIKRDLATDPEVQAFEDALCLVFLETQFDDVAAKLDHERMASVVHKTLAKMSDEGIALARTITGVPETLARYDIED